MKTILRNFLFLIVKVVIALRYKTIELNKKESKEGVGRLILSNNTSWIDVVFILESFGVDTYVVIPEDLGNKKRFRFLMKYFNIVKKGKDNLNYVDEAAALLDEGKKVCVFPEEAITYSGHMGYFFDDFEKIIEKTTTEIEVTPLFIKGLFGSLYSRASKRIKRNKNVLNGKRKVYISHGTVLRKSDGVSRSKVKQELSEASVFAWSKALDEYKTIPEEFIKTVKRNTRRKAIVDSTGLKLSFKKALVLTILFKNIITGNHKEENGKESNVGVMLPTTGMGVLFNMALLMAGKVVVNLNYTAPINSLRSAIKKADIKVLYTSRQFINKLKERGLDLEGLFEDAEIFFLEDEAKKINVAKKIKAMLEVSLLPCFILQKMHCIEKPLNSTATILFSSGSEGEPKGVILTHKNILTNRRQISDAINIEDEDSIMSCLPLFHAFGFTVTTMWPLLEGIKMVCHPDPKDVFEISKLIYKEDVTTLFSTNSFLNVFIENDKVDPIMLSPLKMVIAGAEKVKDITREKIKDKFSLYTYEGYGATETGPVASVNVPNKLNTSNWVSQLTQKQGTVGMALSGGAFKIVDPQTMKPLSVGEEGMILITGNQVMSGYLKDKNKTEEVMHLDSKGLRWYITGDKGRMDEDGFLIIVDRYSRFAKIKGEMVSLTALEQEILSEVGSEKEISVLAVNLEDERNGEKIALLIHGDYSEKEVEDSISNSSISFFRRPYKYIKVDELPLLGTGKLDFKAAKNIVESMEINKK